MIQIYRSYLGVFFGGACRFSPSCSEYALEAFQKYDSWTAFKLSLTRILKCRPGSSWGFDPVPESIEGCCRRGHHGK